MIYALAILSAAASIPKILQMPQELEFLSAIGISGVGVSILGVVQLVGGILLLPKRLRLLGAGLAAMAFLVSSMALFYGGKTPFGLVSLLPVLATIIVICATVRATRGSDLAVTATDT